MGIEEAREEFLKSVLGADDSVVDETYCAQGVAAWERVPGARVNIRIQWIWSTVGWSFLRCDG